MSKAEITQDPSEVDGITVVFIDTPNLPEDSNGPRIRIYLNDEAIFENPAYPGKPAEGSSTP